MCHKKQGNMSAAASDAKRALALDSINMKVRMVTQMMSS
jgi:hypothetical protein